jgi:hypothetical protein
VTPEGNSPSRCADRAFYRHHSCAPPGGGANVPTSRFLAIERTVRDIRQLVQDIPQTLIRMQTLDAINLGLVLGMQALAPSTLIRMQVFEATTLAIVAGIHAALQDNVAVVQARVLNESIRRRNTQASHTQAAADEPVNRLHPLNKEVRGMGTDLPGMAPIPAVQPSRWGIPSGPPSPQHHWHGLRCPPLRSIGCPSDSIMLNDGFVTTRRDSPAQK